MEWKEREQEVGKKVEAERGVYEEGRSMCGGPKLPPVQFFFFGVPREVARIPSLHHRQCY